MKLVDKIKEKLFSKPDSVGNRRLQAQKLNNTHIRYAVERFDDSEQVIMREGHLNISPKGDELCLVCGVDCLFRAQIDNLSMGELLSHDGVILEGYDLENNNQRKIVAYFKYYR